MIKWFKFYDVMIQSIK